MTDYATLRNIFEMAEVLDDASETILELKTVNATDDKTVTVVFVFNEDKELTGVYTE